MKNKNKQTKFPVVSPLFSNFMFYPNESVETEPEFLLFLHNCLRTETPETTPIQARIKKIMQKDEEVGKVAQATPVVICMWPFLQPGSFS